MASDPTPQPPSPRTGWGVFLVLLLLVGGVLGSRAWIEARRSVPGGADIAWRVTVLEPSGLVIHEPTRFEVEIVGPDGRPVEGAAVEFDLTMPDMEMPLNRFAAPAVPGSPGRYRGEGTFTMKGKWRIEAIARRGDAVARGARIVQVH